MTNLTDRPRPRIGTEPVGLGQNWWLLAVPVAALFILAFVVVVTR